MNTKKRMAIACLLNAVFAGVECVGGLWTGSAAVLADAVHDIGDALSLALAYVLECKSEKTPSAGYTYGYARLSLFGACLTSVLLLSGGVGIVVHAIRSWGSAAFVRTNGMVALAIVGILVNGAAAYITNGGVSLNQKAVRLHLLEDVWGWLAVLIGAIVIRLTGWIWIDALLSMITATVVSVAAVRCLCRVCRILAESAPPTVDVKRFCKALEAIDGVRGIHHLHVWSLREEFVLASVHVSAASGGFLSARPLIETCARRFGVAHITVQWDGETLCEQATCTAFEPLSSHSHVHRHT